MVEFRVGHGLRRHGSGLTTPTTQTIHTFQTAHLYYLFARWPGPGRILGQYRNSQENEPSVVVKFADYPDGTA